MLKQSYVMSYAYMVVVPDPKPTPAWITAHWKQYMDQMRSGDETNAYIAMSLYEIITHKCLSCSYNAEVLALMLLS